MYLKLIRNILLSFLFIISFSFIGLTQQNNEKVFVEHEHVSLQLISSVESIHKENNLHLGLYFKLDPGWKIYWKSPGKAV